MWLLVMFDLPAMAPAERKAASHFRHVLLDLGFEMTQLSVYMRFCTSSVQSETLCRRMETSLPPSGTVQVLQLTDKQYERTIIYCGRQRQRSKKTPDRCALF